MDYSYIIRPLIGAFTGYITNWIAVKMMFRPLHEVKIGKIHIPFTPGIIPKNKERLAISIGEIISNDLLNEETLKSTLLSDSVKEELSLLLTNDMTTREFLISNIGQSKYENISTELKNYLSTNIYNSIKEANLGCIIADQIELAAREKLQGSLLSLFGGNAIIGTLRISVEQKLNQYIIDNGEILVQDLVQKELDKFENNSISDLSNTFNISNIIFEIYEKYITEKLPKFLEIINISQIITNKINSMDVLELEKLILIIMKKELNALVNLGAIIGLVIGLLNLLF